MPMKTTRLFVILFTSFNLASSAGYAQDQYPVFDAHIHYSHDASEAFPPEDAIRRLKEAGVRRAMVSSSSDDGTQKLYKADPSFVIPVLRPYRKRGTLETWMHDQSVIPYLKKRLEQYHYAGIGEFHIEGKQASLPVLQEIIRLARQYRLLMHVHSDAEAIGLIYRQDPQARILWAHAGFEDAEVVNRLMDKQQNLWADLSFRSEILINGNFMRGWQPLLVKHADRFMLGIDTYEPQRWLQIKQVMQWQRELLAALPGDVARKIAYENGERITREYRYNKNNILQ